MLAQKIKAFQNYLIAQSADYLLTTGLGHESNDSVVKYFLTTDPEYAAILIPKQGQPTLFLTPFEVPEAVNKYPEFLVQALNAPFSQLLDQCLVAKSKILIRENNFPVALYRVLEKSHTLCAADNLEKIIAVKNPEEILAMRAVVAKTDDLFNELIVNWSNFKTENDGARFVKRFALEHDCKISFPPIIAGGSNAAEPHHETGGAPLAQGFCVIDIGLEINGYCSDLSRTVYLGTPSEIEEKLYQTVLTSQLAGIAAARPDVIGANIDAVCRQSLGAWSHYFIHGLGHGVGTAVHEWPAISANSQAVLEPGMIITIEPGIYQSGKFGIRIEDDVLVTENEPEVLNQASKKLIILPLPN